MSTFAKVTQAVVIAVAALAMVYVIFVNRPHEQHYRQRCHDLGGTTIGHACVDRKAVLHP